eukprot:7806452-Alexandrium_andersonii.AAC.1
MVLGAFGLVELVVQRHAHRVAGQRDHANDAALVDHVADISAVRQAVADLAHLFVPQHAEPDEPSR